MIETLAPNSALGVADVLRWAASERTPLQVKGSGSKEGLGRPVKDALTLDVSRLAGIRFYEPEELVLAAKPATPMAEIEALLDGSGQELAFEPPDLGPLFGGTGRGTLGGAIACNLSGPRRLKAGAARDHFLGCEAVSGRGEAFKTGGRVMKNVTGYDLCKLLAGSFGTLAVLTDIVVKVLPKAETSASLLVLGLDPQAAVALMNDAASTVHDVSGLAYLPQSIAGLSQVKDLRLEGAAAAVLRLEGPEPSVAYRLGALRKHFDGRGKVVELAQAESETLWREIRDVRFFIDSSEGARRAVWRLSVPPMAGAEIAASVVKAAGGDFYLDWAGGLVWLGLPARIDVAKFVRQSVAGSGHGTLIRGPAELRQEIPVFEPEAPALAALSHRIKTAFDPLGILNRGRVSADY
jgi:glycolate oxidase FAD binding subunit